MERRDAEQKAFQYFDAGFHCAEAILRTTVEAFSEEPDPGITRFASGFGGGIGGSMCETCGALTGGIVAIGWLFGREDLDDDKEKVHAFSADFRQRFEKRFGATKCRAILDQLGNQENSAKCKRLTAEAAGILFGILSSGTPGAADTPPMRPADPE